MSTWNTQFSCMNMSMSMSEQQMCVTNVCSAHEQEFESSDSSVQNLLPLPFCSLATAECAVQISNPLLPCNHALVLALGMPGHLAEHMPPPVVSFVGILTKWNHHALLSAFKSAPLPSQTQDNVPPQGPHVRGQKVPPLCFSFQRCCNRSKRSTEQGLAQQLFCWITLTGTSRVVSYMCGKRSQESQQRRSPSFPLNSCFTTCDNLPCTDM